MKEYIIKPIFALFFLTLFISCGTDYNFNGNWSMVTDEKYYEVKIDSSKIIAYHSNYGFWPNAKSYKVVKDSFLLDLKKTDEYRVHYMINIIDNNRVKLTADFDTIILIKMDTTKFTFDKIKDSLDKNKFKRTFFNRKVHIMDSIKRNGAE